MTAPSYSGDASSDGPSSLGRPFLATAGACIDVKEMMLTFDICGERVTFDFHHPEIGGQERVPQEVKRVDCEESIELDEEDEDRPSEIPNEKEVEQISGALASLQLEESFVYKHGVLESWHLVGKKLGVDSSSVEKSNEVASVEVGGRRKEASEPPDLRKVRRGRTQFDWEAFNIEMKDRARGKDPP